MLILMDIFLILLMLKMNHLIIVAWFSLQIHEVSVKGKPEWKSVLSELKGSFEKWPVVDVLMKPDPPHDEVLLPICLILAFFSSGLALSRPVHQQQPKGAAINLWIHTWHDIPMMSSLCADTTVDNTNAVATAPHPLRPQKTQLKRNLINIHLAGSNMLGPFDGSYYPFRTFQTLWCLS